MSRKTFDEVFSALNDTSEGAVEAGLTSREEEVSTQLSSRSRKSEQIRVKDKEKLVSDERRVEADVQALANNVKLVSIPLLDPKYHAYWGSTSTDMQNNLNEMLRKGCAYVTIDDIAPEYHHYVTKTSNGTDEIRCNEMVLLKMPYTLWAGLMTELHHKNPARLQDALGRDTKRNTDFVPLTMGGISSRNALDGLSSRDDIAFMPDGQNGGALKPIKKTTS